MSILLHQRTRRAAVWAATLAITLAALAAPTPKAHTAEDAPDISAAKRIVAVGGSITEIVYALGEEGRLAGRDSTSVYPEQAFQLPDVGYMRQLSPEGVLSVSPDAILMLEGSGPPTAIDVLGKASVPLVTIPESFDEAGILGKIETVGAASMSALTSADSLPALSGTPSAALASTAGIADRKRVLFVLSMQGGKVLASGTGTAADGIIKMAGGVNVVTEFPGYKQLTDEAVITSKPDLILMMTRTGDHAADNSQLLAHPAVSQTPAAQNNAILRMDGAYLLGFGPRTAGAVRDLAKALYGDRVSH